MALFEYLAETQGMDEVVSAYLNGRNTEKAFGIPYPDLFAAAKAHYEELYGTYLALD